jgi:hypothetical protein
MGGLLNVSGSERILKSGFNPSSKALLSKITSREAHQIRAAERRHIVAPGESPGFGRRSAAQ